MLKLQTELEGKHAYFGHVREKFSDLGYDLGGNWEYDRGSFDAILSCNGGETIYIRVPFTVLKGALDNYDAWIKFETPFVIKHVVNIGLEKDEHSLLTASGFNQFQDPVELDGKLKQKSKWEEAGEKAVKRIIGYVNDGLSAS
ncbi:YugN family protein [Domibacillus indicus]|uniref:YugN family protein n=1 Tax=Domibacillus indicus TaxID=1437523 RepID=UPI000617DBAC|nr:YugN family protein [Domibacillus indicus]